MKRWPHKAFAGYLAAMIDGEGHIEIISDHSVRVRIANTVKPTLDAIIERLGFGRVIEYRRPQGRKLKRLFSVEVSNVIDCQRMFDICGDFIHMKRARMNDALHVIRRVLNESKVIDARNREILSQIKRGRRQKDIASDFQISSQTVSRIKLGHRWPSVILAHQGRQLKRKFPRGSDQSFRLHQLSGPVNSLP